MPGAEHFSEGVHSAGTTLYVGAWLNAPPLALPVAPQLPYAAGMALGLGSWVALPELVSGDGATAVKPSVTKLTHLRSPGAAQEKIPGFLDGEQFSCEFNYTAGLLVSLATLVPGSASNSRSPSNYHGRKAFLLENPDRGLIFFRAFIAGMPLKVPDDDKDTLSVTFEITGAPTIYRV